MNNMSNEKGNMVGWFEIYVTDMNRAKKFYETVFNSKLEKISNPSTIEQEIEMWTFPGNMAMYGANGALVKMPEFSSGQNSVIIYFSCTDCAVEEANVLKFGCRVEISKFSFGQYGYISIVYDTENNMIGLHSMQ